MKAKTTAFWFAAILIASISFGEETDPDVIIKKTLETYKSLDTYSDHGTIVANIESNGTKTTMETSFAIKMKKPNMYLITWEQKVLPNFTQSGAVWDDGTQPYLYMGATKSYSKFTSDEMALGGATGVSGGAANTIPSLVLSVYQTNATPFSRLKEPKLEGSEQVADDDCYVISGSSIISQKEKFWISKTDYLIRKYARDFERPGGGAFKMPEFTDAQLKASLKAMGQEDTEENREKMRKTMQQGADAAKSANLKGISTELHEKVSSPKLSKDDFEFKVPEGVELKSFPLGPAPNAK